MGQKYNLSWEWEGSDVTVKGNELPWELVPVLQNPTFCITYRKISNT